MKIKTSDGEEKTIRAHRIVGVLAVHKTIHNADCYSITPTAHGLAIATGLRSAEIAVQLAQAISDAVPAAVIDDSARDIGCRQHLRAAYLECKAALQSRGDCRHYKDGYSVSQGLDGDYRPMTASEAKTLAAGARVPFSDVNGNVRLTKINGRPKTWARDTSRVEVPLKYGMREYGLDCAHNGRMPSLLVAVEPTS